MPRHRTRTSARPATGCFLSTISTMLHMCIGVEICGLGTGHVCDSLRQLMETKAETRRILKRNYVISQRVGFLSKVERIVRFSSAGVTVCSHTGITASLRLIQTSSHSRAYHFFSRFGLPRGLDSGFSTFLSSR